MASNLSRVNAGGHLLWNLGLEEGVELLPGQCCRVGVGGGILDNHAEVVFAVLLPQLQDVVGALVITGAVQPGSEGVGVGEVEVPGHQRDVAIETLANDVDMGGGFGSRHLAPVSCSPHRPTRRPCAPWAFWP